MRSFKVFSILRPLLFLGLCVLITICLNVALIPPNAVRINFHYLQSGEKYDTVFLGTSHGQYGIDPATVDEVSGVNSLNLCMADEYLEDTYHILQLVLETQEPKRIIYELDPGYWITDQRSGSTEIFFYKEFPASKAKLGYFADKIQNLDFRSTLAPWSYYRNLVGQIRDNLKIKAGTAYKNYDPSILSIPTAEYGGKGFISRGRVEGENKGSYNVTPWQESQLRPSALKYMKKLSELCREKGVELIAITTPVPEETVEKYSDSYREADVYFTGLLEDMGVPYYNFNVIDGGLDRSMTGYWDYDGHMDADQAKAFSRVLGETVLTEH